MKGLSGDGQKALLELKEQHSMSETQIVEALLTRVEQPEASAAIERYRSDLPERPYRRANISPSQPRHSKYNFGDLIGNRAGREFTTRDFARSVDWIRANAYSFARRWHVVLKYELVGEDAIHLWFFRQDDPLAQAKSIKELQRMIQRESQLQAAVA